MSYILRHRDIYEYQMGMQHRDIHEIQGESDMYLYDGVQKKQV